MKIYISIPITGRDLDEVRSHADLVKARLTSFGHKVVTPFEICPETDKPYSYYMGKDIEVLLDCDAVCLCMDYYRSKGCMLEKEAARSYGKRIIYEYDLYERDMEHLRRTLL